MAVTLTRTGVTPIDDDLSGTVGTAIDAAWATLLMDRIDTALALLLPLAGGTMTGAITSDLLFTDALYDIGKSGATRPRDGFFSRNVTVGGTLGVTGITTGTSFVASATGANTGVLVGAASSNYGARIVRSAGGPVLIGVPGAANTDHLTIVTNAGTDLLDINGVGVISVGASANRATTVGTKAIQIFDGTAPAGTLANGVTLYSAAGKLWAMDAAGVATKLTP